ncbi:MAG TPA: hypothetical protein VMT30_06750 [Candidatus Saccharimonadia bacterium]|nr:hypothetical protein [Candidatus Saccharimonadia bacterium]
MKPIRLAIAAGVTMALLGGTQARPSHPSHVTSGGFICARPKPPQDICHSGQLIDSNEACVTAGGNPTYLALAKASTTAGSPAG